MTSDGTGIGIGWRPEIAEIVAGLPGLSFVEVIAETLEPAGPLPPPLAGLRARGIAVVPHGTRLSLGGAEPVEPARVAHLAALAGPCRHRWSANTSPSSGPAASRRGTCSRYRVPGRRSTPSWPTSTAPRPNSACRSLSNRSRHSSTGPTTNSTKPTSSPRSSTAAAHWLLLDIANVYANARQPRHRSRGAAGPAAAGTRRVRARRRRPGAATASTTTPTPIRSANPCWRCCGELCARRRPPAVMLERDGNYPPAAQLRAELDRIAAAAGCPATT